MREAFFDRAARKKTVSLTLNADLYARAKAAGLNASRVAEDALARALAERATEQARLEIRQDLEACDAYVAEHGSPAELARAHFDESGDAV
jgi:antitoxin CcdA